ISRLRQVMKVEVALAVLFARPVLAEFAAALSEAAASTLAPIVSVPREGVLPLSYAQQRLWFLSQFEGASAAYHIAGWVRLSGDLNREALIRALNGIVARHEALRTSFAQVDGQAVQRIGATESGFALREQDLRGELEVEAVLAQVVSVEAQAPFDLTRGP